MGHFKYSATEAEGELPAGGRALVADFLKEVCATTHHRLDDLTHYLYSTNGHVRVIPALSALAAAAAAAATALAALAAAALRMIASKSRRA